MPNNARKKIKELLKKEILAVQNLSKVINSDFDKAVNLVNKASGKVVVSGVGKSGHVGMKIAATMTSLGIPSIFLNPNEALHGDLGIVSDDDVLLAISFSGETRELIKVARHLKKHGLVVISIVGDKNSPLARISNINLNIKIKEEGSPFNLAPMASTTATLVLGDLLAVALSIRRGFTKKDFADFHPGGTLGLKLTKVSELLAKGSAIPLVEEKVSFKKALEEITKKKFGITAVVNRQGRLVGVISDGDVRRFLLSGKFSEESLARDAMTRNPKKVDENKTLQEATALMEQYKITSLFVTDKAGKPVGIIHLHQIIEEKLG
ncbi:MAG: KpsF/GutQ family sugar-phosphate isomerase [Patescibacteria group bacterium]